MGVLETKMGVKFIWGEVTGLDGEKRTCTYKSMHSKQEEEIGYDYCVVACGCNFGLFDKWGESLWFPTVWERVQPESKWKEFDERFWLHGQAALPYPRKPLCAVCTTSR